MKRLLLIVAIFAGCLVTSAQEVEKTLVVYFNTGSAWFIPQLRDNGARTQKFFNDIDQLRKMPGVTVSEFELIGSCSPDGTKEYNDFLGNRRSMLFYERFSSELNYPINKIVFRNESEDWTSVAKFTAMDRTIALRNEAVRIIERGEPGVIQRLKNLDEGFTYQQIYEKIFPEVRTLTIRIVFDMDGQYTPAPTPAPVPVKEEVVIVEEVPVVTPAPQPAAPVRQTYRPEALSLKINAVGWLIGVANVAVELDVARNLSINLPIYYSGWDSKLYTFDFKGLVIQPELRFYIPKTNGLFVGAHAGLAWFNCHGGGDYRYQNSGWKRPTFGGGLNIGYKLPLKKNTGWNVEFGLGAGVYDVKYDIFYNEANGPYVTQGKYSMYYGFDQAHISFMYSFGLGRKEGRK